MRIFLAGGTGAVGRRLVPLLVGAGHHVTATTRHRERTDLLRAMRAEPVALDALDGGAVGEAVARAEPEVIIHQMTALAGTPDLRRFDRWFATTNALRTRGTQHLLAAGHAAGVRRFVAQSYGGWTYAREAEPVKTERDPLDPAPPRHQRQTLAAIRFLETSVLDAPLEGVVLRYGNLYGPGASEAFVELVRKRRVPLIGDGGGIWSWLHVDDAATAARVAAEDGSPGIYNIVDDDPAPVAEWLPYLADAVGGPKPLHLPTWLGRLLAGEVPMAMMTRVRGSSNAKAKHDLRWRPRWRTWRDGFRHGLEESSVSARTSERGTP